MSTTPPIIYTPPPRPIRTRKRSMSAGPASRNRTVDWLGPRTTKAFRAAGLLDESQSTDHQRGGSVDSRYTMATSPSRFGSMSYRSASRTSLSESPRTAPSSFTWGSGFRDKEKEEDTARHAMEMSALLGALSDSQRTARVLQEQNTDLRAQFVHRESELLGIIRHLEADTRSINELEEENAALRGMADDLRREIGDMLIMRKKPSSVFLEAPPANMKMLVREEEPIGHVGKGSLRGRREERFNFTVMSDDSQVSLALSPEHAMLLDDMDATSLYEGSVDR